MTTVKTRGRYVFRLAMELDDARVDRLIELIERPVGANRSVLGGRTSVTVDSLDGVGTVVVKHYSRGGMVRHLVKRRYLRWGAARSERELSVLVRAREIGVNAPEPIAAAYDDSLWYRAWLVTREVPNHKTLADVASTDEDSAVRIVEEAARQICLLVKSRILHVDLHPGNVLVGGDGQVYLIDFDRAKESKRSSAELRDQYILRWRRAVIKHRLPEILSEAMSMRLRLHD